MKRFLTLLLMTGVGMLHAEQDPPLTSAEQAAIAAALPKKACAQPQKPRKILIFSRTTTYRHKAGIPALKEAFSKMGEQTGAWEAVISDDLANFESDKLVQFDCVVMNNTTGAPFAEELSTLPKMDPAKKAEIVARDKRLRENLIQYVTNGGGLVAIHAGADTYGPKLGEVACPEYVKMVGAAFAAHPWGASNEAVTVIVDDPKSPLTQGIWKNGEFKVQDEIYMFDESFDRTQLRVLMALDLARSPITIERHKNTKIRSDGDLALVWIKPYGKGRVFYGAFGHRRDIFANPQIMELYLRGIQYACGDLPADTAPLPFVSRPAKTADAPAPAKQ